MFPVTVYQQALKLAQHCRVKYSYEPHRQGVAQMRSVQNAWSWFSKLNQGHTC